MIPWLCKSFAVPCWVYRNRTGFVFPFFTIKASPGAHLLLCVAPEHFWFIHLWFRSEELTWMNLVTVWKLISEGATTPASSGSSNSVEWNGTAWYSKEEIFHLVFQISSWGDPAPWQVASTNTPLLQHSESQQKQDVAILMKNETVFPMKMRRQAFSASQTSCLVISHSGEGAQGYPSLPQTAMLERGPTHKHLAFGRCLLSLLVACTRREREAPVHCASLHQPQDATSLLQGWKRNNPGGQHPKQVEQGGTPPSSNKQYGKRMWPQVAPRKV